MAQGAASTPDPAEANLAQRGSHASADAVAVRANGWGLGFVVLDALEGTIADARPSMAPDSPGSPWVNSKATRAGPAAEVDTSIFQSLVGTSINRLPPDPPPQLAVVGGHEQVTVTWSVPSNPGPAISGYDVRYRIGATGEYTVASYGPTVTQATITGLSRGKIYQLQVRAKNVDGAGPWSQAVEARVYPNNPPEFDTPPEFNLPEGPSAGDPLGDPYTAYDEDEDAVTYTLEGEDSGVLAIDKDTGQLAVREGYSLDYEAPVDFNEDNVYIVEIVAYDGYGSMVALEVFLTVTDVDEPPSLAISDTKPRVGAELTSTLHNAPENPENLAWQWQRVDDGADPTWVDIADATFPTYTVVAVDLGKVLRAVASYQDEDGVDQEVRSAATAAVRAANRNPAFPAATAARMVPENTLGGVDIGSPISATDADDDHLTYAIAGADVSDFAFDTASGQLSTKAALDYETKSSYQVTVSVTDGEGGSANVAVTIQVTNVREPPGQPAKPTAEGGHEQVTVTWSTPTNPGPAISGYEVQYRVRGAETFDDTETFEATATSGAITELERGRYYEIQVRAKNVDGPGDWSETAEARVNPNKAPDFDSGLSAGFNVAESPRSGDAIGDPYTATDPDGDAVSYTLDGVDSAVFTIGETTGQIAVGAGHTLDFENPADLDADNTYVVEIVADDGYEGLASFDVSITITNVDEPGSVTLSATNPRVGSGLTVTLSDPDGEPDTETWQWQRADDGADPTWADIAEATSATYTVITADLGQVLRAVASYQDEDRVDQEVQSAATAVVRAANRDPAFPSETAVRMVPENTLAEVEFGSPVSATDADDDTLTYFIAGAEASAFACDPASGQLSTSADLDYETKTSYQVTVSVADGEGGAASVAVTIEVTNVNEPPDRPAQPTVVGGHEEVTVTWSAPTNPGPAISGYDVQYRKRGAEYTAASYGATVTQATITDLSRGKYYEVEVRAKNADGPGDWSDTAEARVFPNKPPEFDSGLLAAFSVAESPTSGYPIGGPYTASDSEDDAVSYTLVGVDAGVFAVGETTGQIAVGDGYTLDFENPVDSDTDNTYVVEIVADDGHEGQDSFDVSITITDVDEPGSVTLSATNPRVGSELTATLSDPDGEPDTESWQWQRADDGADPTWVDIADATAATYTVATVDLGKFLRAVVGYQNEDGVAQEVRSAATAAVRAANRDPAFPSETAVRMVPENTPTEVAIGSPVSATDPDDDSLTYALSGANASDFTFDTPSGQLSTSAVLDYETKNTYQVTVSVTDGEGGAADVDVTIQVTNVNEPPDRPAKPTLAGGYEQVTVTWSTPTNPGPAISGYEVQYRIRGTETFDDTASFGSTATSGAITELERGRYYEIQVRAKNADGDGDWSETAEGRVNPNVAPKFDRNVLPAEFSVTEGPFAGDALGIPYEADEDDGDSVTYSLRGVDAGVLVIGSATGQIVVGDRFILDFENPEDDDGDNIYVVEVVADDGHEGFDQMDVALTVTDLDEPGTVALSITDPQVGSELTATLSDPDDEPVVVGWQWQRAADPANPVWTDIIGANAATYVVVAADMGMVLRAVIRYQDQNGADNEVQSTVTFVVDPPNGPPLFPSGTEVRVVAENTGPGLPIGFPVEAMDPEGDPFIYSISGNDAATFDFDPASGQLSTNDPLDFETKNRYQVTVSATDDQGGTANVAVTIRVINVNEPPGPPALTSATGGHEQVIVSWSTPSNLGPATSGYDVQCRIRGAGPFDNTASFGPTATSGAVTGLARGRYYQIQVRAKNAEGDGPWSETAEARVNPNLSPKFDRFVLPPEFSVPEGPVSGDAIGNPYIADEDDGDPVTYSLRGVDAGVLVIGPATGQIMVGDGFILNFENPIDDNRDNVYVIEIVAEDGHGGSDQWRVFVTVTDVFESGIVTGHGSGYPELLPPLTPTPPPSPTPTVTPTSTPTPTLTPSPTPTLTPTPTPTPTLTPTPTPTPTLTPTPTPTGTPTPTLSPTPTFTLSPTPRPTRTPAPTTSPTPLRVITLIPPPLSPQPVNPSSSPISPTPTPIIERTRMSSPAAPVIDAAAQTHTATPYVGADLNRMPSPQPLKTPPPPSGRTPVPIIFLGPAPVPTPTHVVSPMPILSPTPVPEAASEVPLPSGDGAPIALMVALAIGSGLSVLVVGAIGAGALIFRGPQ